MTSLFKYLVFLACTAVAGAAEWKVGVARVKITPQEPTWMAGLASRVKPHQGVKSDIHAKALALEDVQGKISVLVTADLSGFPVALAHRIAGTAKTRFGLERDALWLNASHNHSGPITSDYIDTRPGFNIPPREREVALRYTAELERKILDVIERALAGRIAATLSFQQGFAGFAVNRRRVKMSRELPAVVDQDVPVLAVKGEGDRLVAIVAGYSCHPTVTGDYLISGDWPGHGQEELERMHPGAMALFVQNTGADANAYPRGTHELSAQYGRIFATAVAQVLRAKMKPVRGPLATAFGAADLKFRTGTTTYPCPVQVWRFGEDLKIVALGGEVVADYGIRLRKQHGWETTWVAGYSNDVFAYVPSARVLREGGYEGGEAMRFTNLPGPFAESIEETIVERVDALLRSATPGSASHPAQR